MLAVVFPLERLAGVSLSRVALATTLQLRGVVLGVSSPASVISPPPGLPLPCVLGPIPSHLLAILCAALVVVHRPMKIDPRCGVHRTDIVSLAAPTTP